MAEALCGHLLEPVWRVDMEELVDGSVKRINSAGNSWLNTLLGGFLLVDPEGQW